MGSGCGQGNGSANGAAAATNLAFTKFLFVIARADDDAHGARLRTAGGNVARGFFNDFDIDDARELQSQRFETIQFYVREGEAPDSTDCPGPCIQKARHETVRLVPVPRRKKWVGMYKGQVKIHDSFFEPLDDETLGYFTGETETFLDKAMRDPE